MSDTIQNTFHCDDKKNSRKFVYIEASQYKCLLFWRIFFFKSWKYSWNLVIIQLPYFDKPNLKVVSTDTLVVIFWTSLTEVTEVTYRRGSSVRCLRPKIKSMQTSVLKSQGKRKPTFKIPEKKNKPGVSSISTSYPLISSWTL